MLPSNQQAQYLSNAINPGTLIIPASPTLSSNISSTLPQSIHTQTQGSPGSSPKLSVSQQQDLARQQRIAKGIQLIGTRVGALMDKALEKNYRQAFGNVVKR